MSDQTPPAPSPPRPQRPSDPTHATATRPPPRTQHPRAVRTVNLSSRQPGLDSILISLYREHDASTHPARPSRSVFHDHYSGRAVVVFCRDILPIPVQ
jgi:hypothetical protein